jgi:hypothetical protein
MGFLLWTCLAFRKVYVSHLRHVIQNLCFCTTRDCQCRLCKAEHAYLTYLMLQRQLSHLTCCKIDHLQAQASYIFCAWLHLVLYREHVHSHDSVWLLFLVSTILLYNRPLYCGHFWPLVPAPDDMWGWLWSNWWNEDWQENRSTRRKPAPAPLCPPQIPLDQTRDRTRAAAVGSQRLTAWAMTRPRRGPYKVTVFGRNISH